VGPLTAKEVAVEKEYALQKDAYAGLDSEVTSMAVLFFASAGIGFLLWWAIN